MYTNKKYIEHILEKYNIKNYKIRDNDVIDVDGDIDFYEEDFYKFPIKFGIVKGSFICSYNSNLETLEGAPEECSYFHCIGCANLKTLEGAPKKCKIFKCNDCEKLETLKGAPKFHSFIDCSGCINLKSLKEAPKNSKIHCYGCIGIESLDNNHIEFLECIFCEKLLYLKGFPVTKNIDMDGTPFNDIHKKIGNDKFIQFISSIKSKKHQDKLLDEFVQQGYLKIQDIINLLLTNAYKHKYRGSLSGIRYNF